MRGLSGVAALGCGVEKPSAETRRGVEANLEVRGWLRQGNQRF